MYNVAYKIVTELWDARMAKRKQDGLGDELFGTRLGEARDAIGPFKGEFVPPPDVSDRKEIEEALPDQEDFWRPPARFGSIPVEANPLGWDSRRGYYKLYPQVMLPTQVVERVSFGNPELEPNRLFWGDNLHQRLGTTTFASFKATS